MVYNGNIRHKKDVLMTIVRFGTHSPHTHEIGAAILRCEWQRVIQLILTPQEESMQLNHNHSTEPHRYYT